jgi:amino acid adenylation domain-containing protein
MIYGDNIGTVSARVCAAAKRFSGSPALSCGGREISYAELHERALAVSMTLRGRELAGCPIGILTQRTISSYTGLLGVLYAGSPYVPLNPRHPAPRLAAIARNARIAAVIFDDDEQFDLESFLSLVGNNLPVILPEKSKGASILASCGPLPVRSTSLAYMMFTSGSTGQPKGVLVTHANVVSHIEHMTHMYGFGPGDRLSQTFDLSFDPSVSDMFCAWFNGAALCVLPADEMYCAAEYIRRERLTFWASVPTIGHFMEKLGELSPGAFPTLKHSTFCGEAFPQILANQWAKAAPQSTVENLYGPTEATVYVIRHIYGNDEHARIYRNGIVPIGLPLPGQFAAIIDEAFRPVADGEVGELVVSGSQLSLGYLNDLEKTRNAFVSMPWEDQGPQNRWYRTGDLAFVNASAKIECLGRMDAQIKIGGQRMELGEVEAALRSAANITEVAVIAHPYVDGLPQGVIAFVAKDLGLSESREIRAICSDLLPAAFVPHKIISVAALPLNASGKIDRPALKRLAEESSGTVGAF